MLLLLLLLDVVLAESNHDTGRKCREPWPRVVVSPWDPHRLLNPPPLFFYLLQRGSWLSRKEKVTVTVLSLGNSGSGVRLTMVLMLRCGTDLCGKTSKKREKN